MSDIPDLSAWHNVLAAVTETLDVPLPADYSDMPAFHQLLQSRVNMLCGYLYGMVANLDEPGDHADSIRRMTGNTPVTYTPYPAPEDKPAQAAPAVTLESEHLEKDTAAPAEATSTPGTVLVALARALREQPTGRQILDGLDELGELSVCEEDPREIASQVAALCYLASIPAPAPAGPVVFYRAHHDVIGVGLYDTPGEAQRHCEALVSREYPDTVSVVFLWLTDEDQDPTGEPDDEMAVAELVVMADGGPEVPTGYTVTPLTVASEFDPDADE